MTATVREQPAPLAIGPITRLTLALFAGASGDHNPIHVDLDVARAAGMEDVFAHGMLSMAYLGRLLTDWAGPGCLLRFRVRFTALTPLGAAPTCRGRVVAVHDVDGERHADLELEVVLGDGTRTVAGTATVALR